MMFCFLSSRGCLRAVYFCCQKMTQIVPGEYADVTGLRASVDLLAHRCILYWKMYSSKKTEHFSRLALTIICIFYSYSASVPVFAQDLAVLSSATFQRWSGEIDQLERDHTPVDPAAREIVVARQWIEEGLILLGEGKIKNAALIAERMPLQVELIRVLLATGTLLERARSVEDEVADLGKTLLRLKTRYDRLILSKNEPEKGDMTPPVMK